MGPTLTLEVVGRDGATRTEPFAVQSLWNGGLAFRDLAQTEEHLAELRAQGIEAEVERPMVFPLTPQVLTTADEVDVLGTDTSGEIEFVLFLNGDHGYVGVGSDHSDRVLERVSVQMSKQVCPDVASRQVWPLVDVRDHWDQLVLRSTVTAGGERVVYQEAPLAILCTIDYMQELLRAAGAPPEGLVLFSGTIPTRGGQMLFPEAYDLELEDPVLGRRLHHHYRVRPWARRQGEVYQQA